MRELFDLFNNKLQIGSMDDYESLIFVRLSFLHGMLHGYKMTIHLMGPTPFSNLNTCLSMAISLLKKESGVRVLHIKI